MPSTPIPTGTHVFYETFGDPSQPALVLVQGLGAQMLGWRTELCQQIEDLGFYVIRFDNRDAGKSTHYLNTTYTLADMADDTAGLLRALEISHAHIVGQSMGGMIAQEFAIRYPEMLSSLCLIYTAPHHEFIFTEALQRPSPPVVEDREEAIEAYLANERPCASAAYPQDIAWLRELGGLIYDRDPHGQGVDRQMAAMRRAPDRTDALRRLAVPTLILTGDADRLIDPRASEVLHTLIPDSRLITCPGMGHELPRPLWKEISDAIYQNCLRITVPKTSA